MHLEAKEPSTASFAEIGSIFSEVSRSAVSDGFAYRYWFGVYQAQLQSGALASDAKEMADDLAQSVQPANPFTIGRDKRKSVFVIADNELIGLFESGHTETALHQGDSDNLGIAESRAVIVGSSPIGQAGIGLEEVIDEAEDFSHLVYTRSHRGHPPGERYRFLTQSYTPLGFG
jgi:hypothetical protein